MSYTGKIQHCINAMADVTVFTPEQIVGTGRDTDTLMARYIAMKVANEVTGESMSALGRIFGGRDRTTVRTALQRANDILAEDDYAGQIYRDCLKGAKERIGLPKSVSFDWQNEFPFNLPILSKDSKSVMRGAPVQRVSVEGWA